ncbi:MAG: ABC transporter permease [Cryobacterium sp.]|nr:ABC transporter permease [Cryobacterium sp.]
MYAVQLIIDGVVIGALYAFVALGQVLIFRTTRVLNFAQGAVATISTFTAWLVMDGLGWAWWPSFLLAILSGALIGIAIGALLTFVMAKATVLEKSTACLGIFQLLGWTARIIFGDSPRRMSAPVEGHIELGGVLINTNGLVIAGVCAVAILLVFLVISKTRMGLGMRALAQDDETARQYGVPAKRLILISWSISSAIGAGAGVLVASMLQVDHTVMTTIMIMSFAALVLGGFSSTVGAVVGGITLGVVSSLVSGFLAPSYKNAIVFALVLLFLTLRPDGLIGKKSIIVQESGPTPETLPSLPGGRNRTVLIGGAVLAALILVLPAFPLPMPISSFSVMMAMTIAVISLSVFMGYVGEISLGHGALVALGAYTAGILMNFWPSAPYPIVVIVASLVSGLAGAALGWATIRLSGLYLAVATLVLTFVVIEVVLQGRELTGGATGLNVPAPILGLPIASDVGRYYLAVGTLAVMIAVVLLVLRSPMGQRWVAVRDAPIAAMANGVAVRRARVNGFIFSSMIAGVAGAVFSFVVTHVGPTQYGLFFSIFLLLAVALGGAGSIFGAFLGAAFISILPVMLNRSSGMTDGIMGLTLILVIAFLPGGVAGLISRLRVRKLLNSRAGPPPPPQSLTGTPDEVSAQAGER